MLCARFPRTRSSTLRSSADRALPLLTPVAATVAETSEPHHACSAEWPDQVTYSGDQAHVGASNHVKRSHNFSLLCRVLSPAFTAPYAPPRTSRRVGTGPPQVLTH